MQYLNLEYEICEVRLLWKRDKNDLKPIKNEGRLKKLQF